MEPSTLSEAQAALATADAAYTQAVQDAARDHSLWPQVPAAAHAAQQARAAVQHLQARQGVPV